MQAEFRLIIEPEFYKDVQSGGGQVWGGKTAYELALRAKDDGLLREDADPDKFTRVLAASLAGQRYMADLIASSGDLGEWFEESLEVVLEAMATPQCWRRSIVTGGPKSSSLTLNSALFCP